MTGAEVWQHKPIRKQVYRFDGTNGDDIVAWVDDPTKAFINEFGQLEVSNQQAGFVVASGDFVVLGLEGHVYPVPPGVFLASYDHVEGWRS